MAKAEGEHNSEDRTVPTTVPCVRNVAATMAMNSTAEQIVNSVIHAGKRDTTVDRRFVPEVVPGRAEDKTEEDSTAEEVVREEEDITEVIVVIMVETSTTLIVMTMNNIVILMIMINIVTLMIVCEMLVMWKMSVVKIMCRTLKMIT